MILLADIIEFLVDLVAMTVLIPVGVWLNYQAILIGDEQRGRQ